MQVNIVRFRIWKLAIMLTISDRMRIDRNESPLWDRKFDWEL